MNYVAIIFETNGKIAEARPFSLPTTHHSTLEAYANHIGYSVKVTDTVYNRGNYSGTEGRALVILGPVNSFEAAQSMACSIHGAAIAVDTAKYLLNLTAALDRGIM